MTKQEVYQTILAKKMKVLYAAQIERQYAFESLEQSELAARAREQEYWDCVRFAENAANDWENIYLSKAANEWEES